MCFLRKAASYQEKNSHYWYAVMDGYKLSGNRSGEGEETGLNFMQSGVLNAWSFTMERVMVMQCSSQ